MLANLIAESIGSANDLIEESGFSPAWILLLCFLCLAQALWVGRHLRRYVAQVREDNARLCHAFSLLEKGEYSADSLGLTSNDMQEAGRAYGRMLPAITKTIRDLEWTARHDSLTGLLNPASFKHACQSLMSDPGNDIGTGVLLYVDINDFKKINDRLGHEVGDQFLKACADRFRLAGSTFKVAKLAALETSKSVENYDPVIGRLGGDEFGIFLPGKCSQDEVERFILKLKRLIAEPYQIGVRSLRARIAVGAAFSAEHHNVYDKLLVAADTAMYEAKETGGNSHCFYETSLCNKADRILGQELELRTAIQRNQFHLYFQPQIDLQTNRIHCAEALIRWHHPTRGLVTPGGFMPFAESHGLVDDIGDWVICEAIRLAAGWWKNGLKVTVAINISPEQLKRVELIPLIRASLKHFALPPRALELEITEAAAMQSDELTLERLEGLRHDGVTIALDDFGTGYSNFARLIELPLDTLKLDRSLLQLSGTSERRQTVIHTILELAKNAGFRVLAEGVETKCQMEFLRKAGCHYAQGYFISHPLPQKDFIRFATEKGENTEGGNAGIISPPLARIA